MRLRTTLILLVFVLALLGVWWFADHRQPADTQKVGPKRLLGSFNPTLLERIEVNLTTTQMMVLVPRERDWWFAEPFKDRAKREQVEYLLEILTQNARFDANPEPTKELLEKTGLEPPRARVTLVGDGGTQKISLRIGERDPAQQLVYVRIEGDDAIYTTGANLVNLLDRHQQDWRDSRFVSGDGALVRSIEIARPDEPRIVAERTSGSDWSIVAPFVYPGDDDILGRLVNGLLLLSVDNFLALDAKPEDLEKVNLGAKATVVTLMFGTRKLELRFGGEAGGKTRRYAIDSERNHGFVVNGPALALLDTPAKGLRDKFVARVPPGDVTRVRVDRDGETRFELQFRASERRFYYVQPFTNPCDDARNSQLRSWLGALTGLQASDFLDPDERPAGVDVDEALGFKDPHFVCFVDTATGKGASETIRIEVGDDTSGKRPVRRTDKLKDVIWMVPTSVVDPVGDIDPRVFLAREIVPDALQDFEKVTIRLGDRSRTIVRTGEVQGTRGWIDPTKPNASTADIQAFVFRLKGLQVDRILPRDEVAADGFEHAATIDIEFSGPRAKDEPIHLEIGAKDESGKLVAVKASRFPNRTVALADAWLRDELEPLFK